MSNLVVPVLKKVAKIPLLVGQCVPCVKQNAAKIRIKRLELDTYILKYYHNVDHVYVNDPDKLCKTGDIVLIKKLPENLTKLISHELVEVLYPLGDVTDPITGKKVVWTNYRESLEKQIENRGRLPSTFDYEKAPPRGWQDGKKDFTSKPTYMKYHVFPEEDPYAI